MSLGVEHACVRALWCFSVAYGSFGTGPGLGQVPFSLFSRIFIERDLAFLVLAFVITDPAYFQEETPGHSLPHVSKEFVS